MFKIVKAPLAVLSKRAQEIRLRASFAEMATKAEQGSDGQRKIDKSVLHFIEEMKETLLATRDPEGVGLAAPQVGKSVRIFITKQSPKSPFTIFINPEIIKFDEETAQGARAEDEERGEPKENNMRKLEGCLSLPGVWGEVLRSPGVTVKYMDEQGKNHTRHFTGFLATIIQHEQDHLDGMLFPKRVLEQKGKLFKSKKDEKGRDIFEELDL